MNRRQFISSLVALCSLPLFTRCSQPSSLKVGLIPWIGFETLCLANNLHWLPKEIELIEFQSTEEKLTRLISGELDVVCITVDDMLQARDRGIALTAITVFDVSAGADVVIAREHISSLNELKDKRIGVENSALGSLMVAKLLTISELSPSDISVINCPLDKQKEYWLNDKVDVIITYSPTSDTILNESGHVLLDSSQLPDTIIDVLAVKTELLSSHGFLLKKLVQAHFQSVNHIRYNYDDALYRIADHQKISFKKVKRAFSGIIQPSLEANREYLSSPNGRLIPAVRQISKVLLDNKLISKEDKLVNFMSSDYLPSDYENL